MYPGGKAQPGIYQRIINQIPPHDVYVEPFLGGGAVMRAKRPAVVNIGLDLDRSVIAAFGDRIHELQLIEGDGIGFLKSYNWRGDEFVYCDPPYPVEVRASKHKIYRFEMTERQHRELLKVIKTIPARVAISSYWSSMYAKALADWRTVSFQAVKRNGEVATEWLWMNYAEPAELHDYQYLGESFRERERIKRKINRWVARLEKMPILERRALSAAIAKVDDATRLDLASSYLTVSDRTSLNLKMGPEALIAKNEDARGSPDVTMTPASSPVLRMVDHRRF